MAGKPGDMIVIEHPKTGETFAVLPRDFHGQYEDLGFKALHWEWPPEKYVAPEKARAAHADEKKA